MFRINNILIIFSLLALSFTFSMVDITENKKFRKIIFDRIFDELSDKIYYPYEKNIWIVDFNSRNWFLQYSSEGYLYYNRDFFNYFFKIFSINQEGYQKLLKFWFETKTGYRVNHISRKYLDIEYYIDGIRKNDLNEWSLSNRFGYGHNVIAKYLTFKGNIGKQNVKLKFFLNENGIC